MAGYALLGASWLMVKTADDLHGDARRWTRSNLGFVAIFLVAVSITTAYGHPIVADRWGWTGKTVDWARFTPLSAIPLIGLLGVVLVLISTRSSAHRLPFLGSVMIFLSGFLGLAADFAPYLPPYDVTFREAAAPPNAQLLMLVGALITVPLILAYQAWVYWIFRGKVGAGAGYH